MREKIAVLMGGRSLEREVSLQSGKRVIEALKGLGHRALALDVTPDLVETLRSEKPDAVYIALHGKFGEDGMIQELLEFLKIPYTGSGVLTSMLAWDKDLAKRLFLTHDIPTPPWVAFSASAIKETGAARVLDLVPGEIGGFPMGVKPAAQGSALGLSRVESADELADAMLGALGFDIEGARRALDPRHRARGARPRRPGRPRGAAAGRDRRRRAGCSTTRRSTPRARRSSTSPLACPRQPSPAPSTSRSASTPRWVPRLQPRRHRDGRRHDAVRARVQHVAGHDRDVDPRDVGRGHGPRVRGLSSSA